MPLLITVIFELKGWSMTKFLSFVLTVIILSAELKSLNNDLRQFKLLLIVD